MFPNLAVGYATRHERGVRTTLSLSRKPQQPSGVQSGDYYHSESRLFRVEQTHGARVLIEDCFSGELFDIRASELDRLTATRPRSAGSRDATPPRSAATPSC
jgi:hypothetical protein